MITRLSLFMCCAALALVQGCASPSDTPQTRTMEALDEWRFVADTTEDGAGIALPAADAQWTSLSIPHAFRLSGLPEKSAGFYRRTLSVKASDADKRFYLFLEGAGSVVDVFVNGTHMGQHKGAYTAAWFDLSPALVAGAENDLIVRVSNRDKEASNCLSQSNLFYTNGGLYRPAWLVTTHGVHIYPDLGSTGVYLTPGNITAGRATLAIETHVRNATPQSCQATVRNILFDPDGQEIGRVEKTVELSPAANEAVQLSLDIDDPALWDIRQPNLYSVTCEILIDGNLVDTVTERTGIRTIAMEDGNFMLNGEKLLVRGVCKHHQDEHVWNAETSEMLEWEMDGMLDLGCNGIRLAHYPHRRLEYAMADERGVVVWAENGLAGQKWDSGAMKGRESKSSADGERITREMVRQNWNHPSIVFWSSGNETYQEVASHYADIIREEDQTRLITYASAGETPGNVDFVAGNTYQGWYYEHYSDFKQLPRNAFISETGAGTWITHHIPYNRVSTDRKVWTVDRFEPEEYGELVAEYRFQEVFRNNPDGHKMFLWWNYREFYDRKFKNNRNTKGILTLGGMPKDYYYLFQSFMRTELPVLQLCGRHHFYRRFDPANGIKAYSNAESVELFINGKSAGVMKNGDYRQPDSLRDNGSPVEGIAINNVFFWNAPLDPGKNVVVVRDNRGVEKSMVVYQHAESMPVEDGSLVVDLESSNGNNPAIFIDRPVEAQGAFYTEVDGSSDNTFDALPEPVEGARWIATKRLSLEANATEIRFKVARPAQVFVMYSTGTYPAHTLIKPNAPVMAASRALVDDLLAEGFADASIAGTWRQHSLWLENTGLAVKTVDAGETVAIPAHALDYVVLVKER